MSLNEPHSSKYSTDFVFSDEYILVKLKVNSDDYWDASLDLPH